MTDSLRALVAAALGDVAQTFGQTGALLARRPSDDMLFAQADAALAAIEASGTHVVMEVEPAALERVVEADFLRWCVYGGYTDDVKRAEWFRMRNIELEQFRRRYSALIAARPRDAAPTDKED